MRTRLILAASAAAILVFLAAVLTPRLMDATRPARPDAARTADVGPPEPVLPDETTSPSQSNPPSTAPSKTPSTTDRAKGTALWHPTVGSTWQWQLSGKLDRGVAADVYDVDLVDTTEADVAALHSAGRHAVCYVNAGAYEDGRPDAKRYPQAVLGSELDGWPGEHWLDIRRWDVLEPILSDRFETCRSKGFDGVEPDNVDGYAADNGFGLTAADQLTFNRRVADLAHRHGLAVALKNDVEQVDALVSAFDFAVNEECARYQECGRLSVFIKAGKPVFHTEYDVPVGSFCPTTKPLRFSSIRKHLELDAWRETC